MAELDLKIPTDNNNKQSESNVLLNVTDSSGFSLKTRDPTPGRSDTDDSSSGGSVTSEPSEPPGTTNVLIETSCGLKEIEIACGDQKTDFDHQDQLRLSPEGKANTDALNLVKDSSETTTKSTFNSGDKSSSTKNNHDVNRGNRNQGPPIRVVVGAADDDGGGKKTDKIAPQTMANYFSSSSNSYQNAGEATWTSKTTTMLTSLHAHHPNIRKMETQQQNNPVTTQMTHPGPGPYHYGLANGNGYHHHQSGQHLSPKPHYGAGVGAHRKHSPSRRRYGPPNSRGNSPCNGIGPPGSQPVVNLNIVGNMAQQLQPQQLQSISNGPAGQHVVDLHVNPGETISFQIGEQVQLIQGPATVRMVSNNSTPPVPMPVQVPPGHIVQQLVDENGTLRQIILSPQLGIALPPMHLHPHAQGPPQPGGPHHGNAPPPPNPNYNPAGPNNGTGSSGQGGFYGYPPPYINPQFHPHMQNSGGGGSGLTPPPNQQSSIVQSSSSGANLQAANSPTGATGPGGVGHHHHVHHHHHHHHGATLNNNNNNNLHKSNNPALQIAPNANQMNPNATSGAPPAGSALGGIRDERAQKQFYRLKKKLEARNQKDVIHILPPQMYPHVGAGVGSGGIIPPHPLMTGTPTSSSAFLSPNHSPKKGGGTRKGTGSAPFRSTRYSPSSVSSVQSSDGQEDNSSHSQDDEEDVVFVQEVLSKLEVPTITNISARSVSVSWKAPDLGPPTTKTSEVDQSSEQTNSENNVNEERKESTTDALEGESVAPSGEVIVTESSELTSSEANVKTEITLRSKLKELGIEESEFVYELYVTDRKSNSDVDHKDARSRLVFRGKQLESRVKDLKPATEYHFFVRATFDGIVGSPSLLTSCQTEACEPDIPISPKLVSKTKTSLMLKWNAPLDNGSKLTSFSLEYDEGTGREDHFVEIFSGLQKQFKVPKLNVSTRYGFRLSARNDLGSSDFSEVVYFSTSGSVPPQPSPPVLRNSYVSRLALEWQKRINIDDEFTLQMEDETTRHGFLPVYNGRETSYTVCNGLRRNSEYKFRLCSFNEEGASPWSKVVAFSTLPDKPGCPGKPSPKGKIHSNSFRLEWDAPKDDGGSPVTKYVVEIDKGKGFEVIYSGVDNECQCDNLSPGTTYRVRVMCSSVGGHSDHSEPSYVTTSPVVPGRCAPPRLHGKPKALLLHLKWAPPDYNGGSPITEYEVDMTTPDNKTRSVFKGRETDCVVASLLPGRPYLFQVRASNRVGAGLWSEPFETVSGAGPPDCPPNLQVTCRSPHSVYLSWEEPLNNGAIIGEYRIDWSQNQDRETDYEATFSLLHVCTSLNHEVKSLIPATRYLFKVQAVNSAGPGMFSEVVSCVTQASSPSGVSSASIELVSCEANSVTITWKEPSCHGSPVTNYNLEVTSSGEIVRVLDFTPDNDTDGTSPPEYTINDLNPETSYRIRIQAANAIGPGPFSSSVKVTTRGLPPTPPSLDLVGASQNALKLKWGEGRNADFVHYTLEMENSRSGCFVPVYVGTSQSHKVSKLRECAEYKFRIMASNAEGEGPYSREYVFQTTKALPQSLKAPKVSWTTSSSCQVEWIAVKPVGEDPVSYILQLQNPKENTCKAVYQGTETRYSLDSPLPKSSSLVRVAAVRHCSDGETLQGAWSPSVALGQPENAANKNVGQLNQSGNGTASNSSTNGNGLRRFSASYAAAGVSALVSERKPLTDQQWAMIILLGFTLFAILVAMAIERFIS